MTKNGAVPEYLLPPEAIAQEPIEPRDHARLLVDMGPDHVTHKLVEHKQVRDLPEYINDGDVIVVNDTKVLPARLLGRKDTGGVVEVFLLEPNQALDQGGHTQEWMAMVRPGARVAPGTQLNIEAGPGEISLSVEVGERLEDGLRMVRLFSQGADVLEAISHCGQIPLPPYINTVLEDPDRYQTVYARVPGSVAAPTAGLHLTEDVLKRCRQKGAKIATVDLAVGLGTFRPVTADLLADHHMHEERFSVPLETMEACRAAKRVVAIGTTSVRALESAAASGWLTGRTSLFISGDYKWQMVDVLMTNFHQPRSTLLAMIESFIGPRWQELYSVALSEGYRFLSFGDAMLLSRRHSHV